MTARVIGEGFYSRNGFVVVPELDARMSPTAQVVYPKELAYERVDTEPWEKEWKRIGDSFWGTLEEFLPGARKIYSGVEVVVTRYGTISSGARLGVVGGERARYYLRADAGVEYLGSMLINNLLFTEKRGLGITWSKREALMDFIMTRPAMKRIFPHFEPVFSQLSRVPVAVRRESEAYVRSLGIAVATPELTVERGKILVRGVQVGKELSRQEKVVLKLLVERAGDLVTYDELADQVWGEGEFKTFWALNKVVERVRHKLGTLGIDTHRLESVRGQGYLLN